MTCLEETLTKVMSVGDFVDVAIVGAGFSGLAAAHELQQISNGKANIIILEAKDRVGGRVYSKSLPGAKGKDDWDLGGQWVSSSQIYVMHLVEEFGLDTSKQFTDGKKKMMMMDLDDIRTQSGLYPALNVVQLLDLNKIVTKMNKMVAQIPVDDPLSCKKAVHWDSMTLQTFLEQSSCCESTVETFACAMRTVYGAEPLQISLFYFLYYSALAGGANRLVDHQPGDAQELTFNKTAHHLAVKMSEKIGLEKIKLNQPVTSIDQNDPTLCVLTTIDGSVYKARYVIVAIPPHLVNQIRFNPPLPTDRRRLGEQMPMGHLIKVIITYRTAFWKKNGESGEGTFLFKPGTTGPLAVTFDATTFNNNPAIVGFIGGEHATFWSTKTMEERKLAVIECLVGLFGQDAETQLIHYEDIDWAKVPYNGGCPVSIMQPGCLTYFHQALRRPFDRVFWAGTESARKWTGYIDGAVESGQRAANEVYQVYFNNDDEGPKLPLVSPLFGPAYSYRRSGKKSRLSGLNILKAVLCCGFLGGAGYFTYNYMQKSTD